MAHLRWLPKTPPRPELAGDAAAQRDAAMAKTLTAFHRDRPGSTVVTLSGNVHNRTVPGVPWDETFVPMGAWTTTASEPAVPLPSKP